MGVRRLDKNASFPATGRPSVQSAATPSAVPAVKPATATATAAGTVPATAAAPRKITIEELVGYLDTGDLVLQRKASAKLIEIKDPRSIGPLIDLLRSSAASPGARRMAAHVLGAIGDVRAVEAMKDALADVDVGVRNTALDALRRMSPTLPAAVEAMKEALGDSDAGVRNTALESLKNMAWTTLTRENEQEI